MTEFRGYYRRSDDGKVWLLPVYTLANSRGRRIRLVALMHHAHQSYYKLILEREIAPLESEDAIVLMEGIEKVEGEYLRSEDEYAAHMYLDLFKELKLTAKKKPGIVDQDAVFTKKRTASWINADVSYHTLCRMIAEDQDTLKFAKLSVIALRRCDPAAVEASVNETSGESPFGKEEAVKGSPLYGPMILKRNEALLARIAAIQEGDLVIPWGGGHAEGLFAAFEAQGYSLKEVTWYPALPA